MTKLSRFVLTTERYLSEVNTYIQQLFNITEELYKGKIKCKDINYMQICALLLAQPA